MEFATLILKEKDQNISAQLVQKGFAKPNLSKFAEENSKFVEELVNAEKKAVTAKCGLHSKKEANIYKFVDTTVNAKASKTIESSIKDQGKLDAVVDYVFSGHRYKLRIDRENVIIGFGLLGVRSP